MHILMVVATGLVLLGMVYYAPNLFHLKYNGMQAFIWVWLALAIGNGLYGHFRAGIPVINEIGAFIPIFGIPAAVAWFLIWRAKGTT